MKGYVLSLFSQFIFLCSVSVVVIVKTLEKDCLPYSLKTYHIASYLDAFGECRTRGGVIAIIKEQLSERELRDKGFEDKTGRIVGSFLFECKVLLAVGKSEFSSIVESGQGRSQKKKF